jgi:hypothetical protein
MSVSTFAERPACPCGTAARRAWARLHVVARMVANYAHLVAAIHTPKRKVDNFRQRSTRTWSRMPPLRERSRLPWAAKEEGILLPAPSQRHHSGIWVIQELFYPLTRPAGPVDLCSA